MVEKVRYLYSSTCRSAEKLTCNASTLATHTGMDFLTRCKVTLRSPFLGPHPLGPHSTHPFGRAVRAEPARNGEALGEVWNVETRSFNLLKPRNNDWKDPTTGCLFKSDPRALTPATELLGHVHFTVCLTPQALTYGQNGDPGQDGFVEVGDSRAIAKVGTNLRYLVGMRKLIEIVLQVRPFSPFGRLTPLGS